MAQSGPVRILYIEDDPGLARLVQKRLGKVGYSVDIASDGDQGITQYHADSYDVVLVDQTLPVYDGLEVIRMLGSNGSLPPTVMITGTGDERVAVEAMKLGAGDYIVKDAEAGYLELLPSAIEKVLDQRRAVTEKQRAEEAYRAVGEHSLQGLHILQGGREVFVNSSYANMLGYTVEELVALSPKQVRNLVHPEDQEIAWGHVRDRIAGKPSPPHYEFRIIRKDGSVRWVETFASRIVYQGKSALQVAMIDITERKQAEDSLRKSESRYRTVVEDMPAFICRFLPDGTLKFVNGAYCKYFDKQYDELVGQNFFQFIPPEERKEVKRRYSSLTPENPSVTYEHQVINPDGMIRYQQWTDRALFNEENHLIEYQSIGIDITDRKRAENALRESEERFRQFFENEPEYCYMTSPEGIILDINNAALKMLGYTKKDLIGKPLQTVCAPESLPQLEQLIAHWKKTGSIKDQEISVVTKNGTRRIVLLSVGAVRDEKGKIVYGVSVQRDITEHKWMEETLQKTEEHLRIIVEGASDGFIYLDKGGIILLANEHMKKIIADPHPEGKPISAFYDEENQKILAQHLTARWKGKGTIYEIALTDAKGRRHNLLVSGTPYRDKQGVIQGAFGIYHDVTQERETARIISEHKEALKNSFFGTAEALSKVIEDRDPYTSGHSAGVAGLVEAIARQMGLPEDQITGIYIAGLLHDIGKMAVPVEILVKPGRLTEMEMSLIKIHPQAGYEILQGIDFPWPVAQATLQHHERMDGSGYPHGLRGDEIIQEARILAVADVVNAMTHHRPYRPAFSLRDAMEEIKKGRGKIYDPQVVDACLEVLEGKQSFITSEYSTTSTSPQLRRGSKKSSTLPTTTQIKSLGRR